MTRDRWGFYSKRIFPWVCDMALDQPQVASLRRSQLAGATGEILEIGIGTGLNLPCYPSHIRRLVAIDPNPGTNKRLHRRIEQTGIEVDRRMISGESLPFADNSFDFVVSTFTLCSIPQVVQAIREVHRVLKSEGRLVFLEHGLSPDSKVQRWQRRLNWLQGMVGDGCRLDVDVRHVMASSPFKSIEISNSYLDATPRTHGYLYHGSAIK